MVVAEFKPSARLEPYVLHYRVISSVQGSVNRILPSTSLSIAFTLKGRLASPAIDSPEVLPTSMISGLRKSARLIEYQPGASALIVIFKPTGAAAFIQSPLQTFFEKSFPLNDIFSARETAILEDRLRSTESNAERVRLIEAFLFQKLLTIKHDALISSAIAKIERANGIVRISDLCKELFISRDAFEKRFRRVTGTTAKQFAMTIRLNRIMRFGRTQSFLDLAISNGYHDQAHFAKDFKVHAGLSPTEFFQSASYW